MKTHTINIKVSLDVVKPSFSNSKETRSLNEISLPVNKTVEGSISKSGLSTVNCTQRAKSDAFSGIACKTFAEINCPMSNSNDFQTIKNDEER